ncbi:MAG TPA: DUF1684 domain-containing protein [Candidatus Saccharimonadales bacterium]|nr:DUF1684 domain-containing protein [Candidatus Saccharimonadales bacterium]
MIPGDGTLEDRLTLADWRRRIATLYSEVRAMAVADPAIALAHWRAVREWLYRTHPQSPVPAPERAAFTAHHFDHDPRLRFDVVVEPVEAPDPNAMPLALPSSGAETLSFSRIGTVRLPLPDGERSLSLFWLAGYAGGLFIPFRDATNGIETYAAGRYLLDGAKSADLTVSTSASEPIVIGTTLTLDCNFAFQPSCAFDPRWACPLAPPENRLDVAIRAGERLATG